jgi:imidazole glycerol-phosphate synthase subunit HisH
LTKADITLVNYGLGNIQAFAHIYRRLNLNVEVATNAEQLAAAQRLILPGVGAFDWAMARLNASGMRAALDDAVLYRKVPVLGVCVGMQMMADRSDEGEKPGLGWIKGDVRAFSLRERGLPLPHMGWNDVVPANTECLFEGIEAPKYYFLHSYCIVPANNADALATADYGNPFVSAIRHGNIFGTQFHPEKSHNWGVDLLRNFARQ